MSESTAFFKTNFVGRDEFVWWIGQIVDAKTWEENIPENPQPDNSSIKGFGERYRVRIMGYHSCTKDVPDDELPFAYLMYPVTAGGAGANYQNSNLTQGNFVFGFFIDGEDAQIPIIMGVLGYNEYQAVMKNLPEECYVPFNGTSEEDNGSEQGKEASFVVREEEGGGTVLEQDGAKGQPSNQELIVGLPGSKAERPLADKEEKEEGEEKEPLAKPTDCEETPLGRIQKELSNTTKKIQKLKQSQFNSRIQLVTGAAGDIASQIDNLCEKAAEYIAGILKTLLDKLMKYLINKTGEQTKEVQDELMPNERPTFRKMVEELLEKIVCLIRKLIDKLLDMVKEFVCDAADKTVNTPNCLVNNFVGNMMNDLNNQIDNEINQGLDAINGFVGSIGGAIGGGGGVGGGLGGAGGIEEIMSFLKCDDDIDCSELDEWSIWKGPDKSNSFDISGILGAAGQFGGGGGGQGGSGSGSGSSGSGGGSSSGNFDNVNIDDTFNDPNCDTGPRPCGPPTVKFFGRSGSGASGNLVISSRGEIMSYDAVETGSNYAKDTFAIVLDECGNGGGAIIDPIIDDDGKIIDIDIIDPGSGYLPEPDGSKGGDDDVWSPPGSTIIEREDGTYEPPIPPGNVVDVEPGDTIEIPPGTIIEIDGEDCVQTVRGGSPTLITCGGKFTTPEKDYDSERGPYPNTEEGKYPAILYLCEIIVEETGINYASTDQIVITPDLGAVAVIETGDQGSIRAVKVTESGEGYTVVPKISIRTETGYNAVLRPKLCIDRVGDEKLKEPTFQDKVVSVVDCVGKF